MAEDLGAGGGPPTQTCADPLQEAARIADHARDASLNLCVTGGVAVAMHCPSAAHEPLRRDYADIDCVGRGRDRRSIAEVLTSLGYLADESFNALHGERRLLFWDPVNEKQLDVFLDRVEMCHEIDLSRRLDIDRRTLSLADLLLMKLQVVETNRKDFLDIVALLVDHSFTDDDTGMNIRYLAELTARDWGLWRTTTMIAQRTAEFASDLEGLGHRERVRDQVHRFVTALDEEPKSRGWKIRARIGERKRWYELPEEAG